jgi:predicted metal-dependent hydrolase
MTLTKVALHPRNVHFDWIGLPMSWIPGEAFASHLLNVLHLLLPEGERFFVKVFAEALPLITDDELREDVLGFIGQEGMHATAHQGAQDYLRSQGLDPSDYVAEIETIFRVILGDRGLSGARSEQWLIERLAFVAAIEHVTAFLGDWILNSPALDAARADPRMLDLLRWHGAEEVEHRAVAYDLFRHVDGRYSRRVRTYVVSTIVLGWLWARGVRFLIAHDPELPRGTRARWRDYARAVRGGIAPSPAHLLRSVARYVRPSYHPSHEGSTSQAVAYLATSPAALAADA